MPSLNDLFDSTFNNLNMTDQLQATAHLHTSSGAQENKQQHDTQTGHGYNNYNSNYNSNYKNQNNRRFISNLKNGPSDDDFYSNNYEYLLHEKLSDKVSGYNNIALNKKIRKIYGRALFVNENENN